MKILNVNLKYAIEYTLSKFFEVCDKNPCKLLFFKGSPVRMTPQKRILIKLIEGMLQIPIWRIYSTQRIYSEKSCGKEACLTLFKGLPNFFDHWSLFSQITLLISMGLFGGQAAICPWILKLSESPENFCEWNGKWKKVEQNNIDTLQWFKKIVYWLKLFWANVNSSAFAVLFLLWTCLR